MDWSLEQNPLPRHFFMVCILTVDILNVNSIIHCMISTLFQQYKARKNWTIDDLVHTAAEIIPFVAGPQERHKVTELPDPRTVRYYIQEGVVDRPHATSGSSALYGYRHLLQLVAIKVLQSLYLPIRRIRLEIKDLTNAQLEERLDAWSGAHVDSDAPPDARAAADSMDLDSKLQQEVRSTRSPDDAPPDGRREAARRFLESLRARSPGRDSAFPTQERRPEP